MATLDFQIFAGSGPSWVSLGANRLVFSADPADPTVEVVATEFQDGTHAADGTPGTDQCGANHANNVKYISDTEMSVNGAANETINDTNLLDDECTLRIHFNHTSAVAIANARLYLYDGTTTTEPVYGVRAYAFERGVGASAWTLVNDDLEGIGGDNVGERLELVDSASATDHFWYVALSASPKIAGALSDVHIGVELSYS